MPRFWSRMKALRWLRGGSLKDKLQDSTLVFATNTVVIGNSYASVQSGYADCVKACAADQKCLGFNHDGANNIATCSIR